MKWIAKTLLLCASCALAIPCLVEAGDRGFLAATSRFQDSAYIVRRGKGPISLTEIWVLSAGDDKIRKLRVFPGEPGTLYFSPNGEDLIYLERSLRHEAWGSSFYGGHSLPVATNRIWRVSLDGTKDDLWPLSEDFQPELIALSPLGRSLAIIGYRGDKFVRADYGLWIADDRGGVRLLHSGNVGGPVEWSADGTAIFCRGEDGQTWIRVNVNTGEIDHTEITKDYSANVKPDQDRTRRVQPTAALLGTDDADGVLGLIGSCLDLYIRGRNALHRGNDVSAKELFKQARRTFKSLYEQASTYRLSSESCVRYTEACEFWIEADRNTIHRHNCQERVTGLLRLIREFKRAGNGSGPADLSELHQWATNRIVAQTPPGNEREDWKAVLGVLFSCPANREYAFLSDYLYLHEGLPDSPPVACFWHRGEQIDGVAVQDGGRTTVSSIQAARVDSLASSGRRAMDADKLDRARLIFRNVARQRPRDPDPYIHLGHVLITLKRFKESKEAFHRALRLGSKAEAHYGLGMLYKTWPMQRHFAIHHFTEALIRDQQFVDARYQMARVRYDMKERDAELEAKRVLELDPEHAGAFLLIADYYLNLSWEFEKAVVWYTKYLALRPEDAGAQRSLGIAYLKVRDYSKIMSHLFDFVQRHPDSIELMPVVAISAIKQDSLDMAMRFFEDYISKLTPDEKRLYENITHIASREQLKALGEAEGIDHADYLERFWNSRDPDLSTSVNERLLEHYRRVWYALTDFSKGKKPWDARGEVYIRFGEPDHRSRSDEPNFKQSLGVQRVKERLALDIYKGDVGGHTFVGPVYPVRSLKQLDGAWYELRDINIENASASSGGNEPGDVAIDDAGGGAVVESDISGTGTSVDEGVTTPSAAPNDAIRIGILPMDERLGFGDYHPVTTGDDPSTVPWETWIYVDVGGGIEITFTDEIGSGTYDYAPIPPNQGGISIRQTASLSTHSPRSVFQRASTVTPDFYTPEDDRPPLDFHYSLADFRGSDDRSLLEVYYGVPILPGHYISEEDVTRQVLMNHAALISASLDTVYRQADELTYEAAGNQAGEGIVLPGVLKLNLPPGAYRLEVKSQDRLRGQMGIYQQQVMVEPYGEDGLQISDLELAWQVGEVRKSGKFKKGDLYVVPMPSRTYKMGQSVFVYYEIYNLSRNEFGQTNYNVSYTITSRETPGTVSNISRLFRWEAGKREELAVTYEQQGDADQEVEYVELALDEQVPGRYSLKVSINDMNSGERAEKDVVFVISL